MRHLTIRGRDLAVLDQGRRVPLLLVHGFPLDHSLWAPQIAAFAADRAVIAPDLAGFGDSDPRGYESLDEQAEDLTALLDALGLGRVVVAGLSMGGYIALALWRRRPERFAGLVLACTRAGADNEAGRAGRYQMALAIEAQGMAAAAGAMLPRLLAEGAPEGLRREVEAMVLRQPASGSVAAQKAMAARPDASPDLAGIAVPTLVIAGEADAIIPADEARAMAAAIPGAQLAILPGAGHLACLEAPAAFNAVLGGFLDQVDAGGPLG